MCLFEPRYCPEYLYLVKKWDAPSRYWINLLIKSNSVPEYKFNPLLSELTEIINILIATLKKLKQD